MKHKQKTYSSEICRCWKSCHDSVLRGFFDKSLQRKGKQRKVDLFHINYLMSLAWCLFCFVPFPLRWCPLDSETQLANTIARIHNIVGSGYAGFAIMAETKAKRYWQRGGNRPLRGASGLRQLDKRKLTALKSDNSIDLRNPSGAGSHSMQQRKARRPLNQLKCEHQKSVYTLKRYCISRRALTQT